MVSSIAALEHKVLLKSAYINMVHGKAANLTQKGGTPWETKAEKKTKTKLKNKKPTSRPKKTKRSSRGFFFNGKSGLRPGEAHHFLKSLLI